MKILLYIQNSIQRGAFNAQLRIYQRTTEGAGQGVTVLKGGNFVYVDVDIRG